MIDWLRSNARLSPTRRGLAVVAVCLVALGAIGQLLTPHSGHRTSLRPAPPAAHNSPAKKSKTAARVPPVPAAELERAHRAAARFHEGYLRFAYGRASAAAVTGVTAALRVQLEREHAQLTPVERRRHPRVVSLQVAGQRPAVVLATALIDDGGIAVYPLRFTLRERSSGWFVSGVDRE